MLSRGPRRFKLEHLQDVKANPGEAGLMPGTSITLSHRAIQTLKRSGAQFRTEQRALQATTVKATVWSLRPTALKKVRVRCWIKAMHGEPTPVEEGATA